MNTRKILPFVLLIVMAVLAITIRRCNADSVNRQTSNTGTEQKTTVKKGVQPPPTTGSQRTTAGGLDRNPTKLFFTKHAKCRMNCRHITRREVKEILATGNINYSKSELQDPRGPTYAVEGITSDRQKVRIIFAPKQQHLTVVTVIDLVEEFACNCN
jgi:hypothetical protein